MFPITIHRETFADFKTTWIISTWSFRIRSTDFRLPTLIFRRKAIDFSRGFTSDFTHVHSRELRFMGLSLSGIGSMMAVPYCCEIKYRKPPTISPGLIYFRKRFLMGLYKEGLYTGGLMHGRSFVLVINKSVINRKINMY
jgi:hypothetical protein